MGLGRSGWILFSQAVHSQSRACGSRFFPPGNGNATSASNYHILSSYLGRFHHDRNLFHCSPEAWWIHGFKGKLSPLYKGRKIQVSEILSYGDWPGFTQIQVSDFTQILIIIIWRFPKIWVPRFVIWMGFPWILNHPAMKGYLHVFRPSILLSSY